MGEEEVIDLDSDDNSSSYGQETRQKKAVAYEKQRALRIAQNKAGMEALGLPKIANSLLDVGGKAKQKKVVEKDEDDDVDYEPESADDDDDDSSDSGYDLDSDSGHDYETQKKFETMEPRDDDGNYQEHDFSLEEQMPSSQAKKMRGRGPARAIKVSEPMFLEFDELDLPKGQWEAKYGQKIGQCALRIDINIHKWAEVDQVKKDILWAETHKMFHIDDPQGIWKKNFLRALAARFRHHKSALKSRFIEKKKVPNEGHADAEKKPWEVYAGYLTEDQWNTFVKKSAIGKECAKGNIHRHTLGQKSYSRKRVDWVKEKRLPPPSDSSTAESSSVVSERVQNRALEWCLAHQRRTREGKWEVDPNKVETARVVSEVMEHLEKEAKEKEEGATSSSEIDFDALSKALGRKDCYGYVKGIGRSGVGVGHRKAFGKVGRKGSTSSQEDIEALKATITQDLESKFEARLQERVAAEVQAYLASLPSFARPSTRELNSTPAEQPRTIKAPKKCRLAVNDDDGNLVVVAEGTAYPCATGVVHSLSLLPDHYKVSIDNSYPDYTLLELPVPSPDGITELGKAIGYFVQWPMSMVLFEDKDNATNTASQSKERVASCDPIRTEESGPGFHDYTIVDMFEGLTEECGLLHVLVAEEQHNTIRVCLKAPLLYLRQDRDIWVTSTDISEFIRGACANVLLIHVYILYLVKEFISTFERENITFLCPERFSAAECKRNFLEVLAYVKHAFNTEL